MLWDAYNMLEYDDLLYMLHNATMTIKLIKKTQIYEPNILYFFYTRIELNITRLHFHFSENAFESNLSIL